VTDAWDDRPIDATWDLALFLGGSADSFTGKLLDLICKAQATPENLGRLELAFPREVTAWKVWGSMSPAPTFRQLREALAWLEPRTDRMERMVLAAIEEEIRAGLAAAERGETADLGGSGKYGSEDGQ